MDSDYNNDDVTLDCNTTDEVNQNDNDNNVCQPIVNGLLTFTMSMVHNSTYAKITELLAKHFEFLMVTVTVTVLKLKMQKLMYLCVMLQALTTKHSKTVA